MSGTLLGRLGRAPTEIAVPLGFILSLLLFAGVGIASARSIGYLRESFLLVDHSRQVLTRLADLAAALRGRASQRLDVYRPRYAQSLAALFPALSLFVANNQQRSIIPLDPAELRARGLQAVVDLFVRISEDGPVLLCLDDMQWADADSIDVLSRLMQADFPLLLVLAVREGEESPLVRRDAPAVETMQLGPLAPPEARALATHLAPQLAECSQHELDEAGRTERVVEILHDEVARGTARARVGCRQEASGHRNIAVGRPVLPDVSAQIGQRARVARSNEQAGRADRARTEEEVLAGQAPRRSKRLAVVANIHHCHDVTVAAAPLDRDHVVLRHDLDATGRFSLRQVVVIQAALGAAVESIERLSGDG